MKLRWFNLVLILLLVAALPSQVLAATAKETVEEKVQLVVTTLGESDFKQLSKDDKILKIRSIVNEVFDYYELSRRCLGREWKKFNAAQQKEFQELFSTLLEETYADRLLAYTSEKITFGKETELKKGKVEVQSAIITTDGNKVPIGYRMILKDGQWRVYDVIIEGISLVKNYRGQFKDILSKKSPEDLLETLRKKTGKS
jgi:phospholipid transport system substrate-binding protein